MRALGYVGAAPVYHKDRRLSGEVIGTFLTDDWDERDRRRVARLARHVDGVRALPRSQVRSDHAEGLLRADGRVRLDGARRASDVRRRSEGRAAIHVAAAAAVRSGATRSICSTNEGTTFTNRRREGGEVEGGDGKPQGRGNAALLGTSIRSSCRASRNTGIRRRRARRPPPAAGRSGALRRAAAAAAAAVPPPPPARGRGRRARPSRS